jgi:hypothetical protein
MTSSGLAQNNDGSQWHSLVNSLKTAENKGEARHGSTHLQSQLLGRLGQEDCDLWLAQAKLVRLCLKNKIKTQKGQILVTHACNSSYLGG